jgi:hypothetical protein
MIICRLPVLVSERARFAPPAAGRGHSERQPTLYCRAQRDKQVRATKTVPPVIDVTAEPILALARLTDRATAPGVASLGRTNHAANLSQGAASKSPARVQSETAQGDDIVEW